MRPPGPRPTGRPARHARRRRPKGPATIARMGSTSSCSETRMPHKQSGAGVPVPATRNRQVDAYIAFDSRERNKPRTTRGAPPKADSRRKGSLGATSTGAPGCGSDASSAAGARHQTRGRSATSVNVSPRGRIERYYQEQSVPTTARPRKRNVRLISSAWLVAGGTDAGEQRKPLPFGRGKGGGRGPKQGYAGGERQGLREAQPKGSKLRKDGVPEGRWRTIRGPREVANAGKMQSEFSRKKSRGFASRRKGTQPRCKSRERDCSSFAAGTSERGRYNIFSRWSSRLRRGAPAARRGLVQGRPHQKRSLLPARKEKTWKKKPRRYDRLALKEGPGRLQNQTTSDML